MTRNKVGEDPARQVFGVCGSPLNCDSYLFPDMEDIVGNGVSLYDLGPGPLMRVDAPPRLNLGNPVKAKARPPQGSNFLIDVADGERGLVVLSAAPSTLDPNQYAVTLAGSYDKSNNLPSGSKFLPGSKDDLLDLYPNLFAANEIGVQAFDDSLTGTSLLNAQTAADGNGAVLLAGFDASSSYGYPTMVFGRNLQDVTIYSVPTNPSTGVATAISFDQFFPNPSIGRGYGVFAVGPDSTPDHTGWLFIVNATEYARPCPGSEEHYSTVRVYRVSIPSVPIVAPVLLGSYIPKPASCLHSTQGTEAGALFDCYVDMLGGNQFMVYATYGPRGAETTTGLVVVKGQFVPGGTPNQDKVVLSPVLPVTTVPVFTDSDDATVGRVTESYGKLYAAFGCHGIAVFTPGGWGELPTLDASWTDPNTEPKRVALQVRRIVGGTSGSILVLATFLNGGIGVFDPANLAYLGDVTTPWQPNAMVPAGGAEPPAVPTIYLADGSGGVHRMEVTPP